jgi:hypothetical protein
LDEEIINKKELGSDLKFSKLYSFATKEDRVLLYVGLFCACLTGLGLPSFVFLIGDVINAFNPNSSNADALAEIKTISLIFLFIGK